MPLISGPLLPTDVEYCPLITTHVILKINLKFIQTQSYFQSEIPKCQLSSQYEDIISAIAPDWFIMVTTKKK